MAAPFANIFRLASCSSVRLCRRQSLYQLATDRCQIKCPQIVCNRSTQCHLYSTSSLQVAQQSEPDLLYKKLEIEVKGHDPSVINSYEKFVTLAAQELNINLVEVLTPPRIIERQTLLKSVHIFKKHRVQYEWRTHFRTFKIRSITGSTADTFLEYIQRNLPEGMAMKTTKTRLETIPSHIKPPKTETETAS